MPENLQCYGLSPDRTLLSESFMMLRPEYHQQRMAITSMFSKSSCPLSKQTQRGPFLFSDSSFCQSCRSFLGRHCIFMNVAETCLKQLLDPHCGCFWRRLREEPEERREREAREGWGARARGEYHTPSHTQFETGSCVREQFSLRLILFTWKLRPL